MAPVTPNAWKCVSPLGMVPWDPLEKEVLKKSNCRPRDGLRCGSRQVVDMLTSNMAKNCRKIHFFHVSRHFRAPPRTRISVKIRFCWLRIMSFQYGFTTTFNLEDWSTVEGARAIWVSAVGNHRHVLCRASIFQHILAHISGQGWSFWKIPFLAGPQGQYLTGNTDFRHFGCVGWFL